MLHATWSVLAGYLEIPADEITIDLVFENREGFPRFLESRKYARNSVRSYANYERILLAKAEEFGWNPEDSFPAAWRGVMALAQENKCADIARRLARIRKTPADVTADDVDSWVAIQVQQGRSYTHNREKKRRFWQLLSENGFTEQISVVMLRRKGYGIPMDQLPPAIRNELIELSRWKQAVFSLGRPKGGRHREVSAIQLKQFTCGLIGYALNIRGEVDITSLT